MAAVCGRTRLVKLRTGIVGPRSIRLMLKIEYPVLQSELLVTVLFVGRSEIKVRVGVAGLDFDGTAQMFDRFFELADFVQECSRD